MPDGAPPYAAPTAPEASGFSVRLSGRLAAFDEEGAIAIVREALEAGEDPRRLVEALTAGAAAVGRLFDSGACYISGLMLTGEIIRSAMETVIPALEAAGRGRRRGLVVLGTPAGDFHDLGKNLAGYLLRADGFEVADLGTGVPARIFMKEILQREPDLVGISILLLESVEEVRRLTRLVKDAYTDRPAPPFFVGCGFLGPNFTNGGKRGRREAARRYLEVDHVVLDGWEAVKLCRSFMEGKGDPFAGGRESEEDDKDGSAGQP
ncbi:MAG: cobalamin-dependent protein [Deltaproteobacteria bacterium]|jgi:methanogenic corrinoid protein MtbC1|nr:cobalamin-dependent protein [Deltaproteobacteria bacterium]